MSPNDFIPPRPRWSAQISMGNVIQIILLLAAFVGAWTRINVAIDTLDQRAAVHAEDIDDLARRVRVLETDQARADERMASILALLGRIDARLERTEQREFPP